MNHTSNNIDHLDIMNNHITDLIREFCSTLQNLLNSNVNQNQQDGDGQPDHNFDFCFP